MIAWIDELIVQLEPLAFGDEPAFWDDSTPESRCARQADRYRRLLQGAFGSVSDRAEARLREASFAELTSWISLMHPVMGAAQTKAEAEARWGTTQALAVHGSKGD